MKTSCFSGGNPFSTSTLREHGDHELCSDPDLDNAGGSFHRVEKRSYLPPVTCTRTHEMNAVKSKVYCQPRPRLVRLPWPNDTSVHKVIYQHQIKISKTDRGHKTRHLTFWGPTLKHLSWPKSKQGLLALYDIYVHRVDFWGRPR
jgi:hypothetical protein